MDLTRMSSSALSSLENPQDHCDVGREQPTIPCIWSFNLKITFSVFSPMSEQRCWMHSASGPIIPSETSPLDLSSLPTLTRWTSHTWSDTSVLEWDFFQLYDSFLSFYSYIYKTALMKYSTRYLGKGRLISQVSDKSANSERNVLFGISRTDLRWAMSIVRNIYAMPRLANMTSIGCLDIFYWFLIVWWLAYKICAKFIQFHHEDDFVSIQCYYHTSWTLFIARSRARGTP